MRLVASSNVIVIRRNSQASESCSLPSNEPRSQRPIPPPFPSRGREHSRRAVGPSGQPASGPLAPHRLPFGQGYAPLRASMASPVLTRSVLGLRPALRCGFRSGAGRALPIDPLQGVNGAASVPIHTQTSASCPTWGRWVALQ
jgi:hypothetical protein